MAQTIDLTDGGEEYTFPVTIIESTGKDISASTVQVSLGTATYGGTWLTPDVISHPTTSTIVVQLLVGGSYLPTAGDYFLWFRVTDTPEIVPRKTALKVTIK